MNELTLGARRSGKTTRALNALVSSPTTVLLVATYEQKRNYIALLRSSATWALTKSETIDAEDRIVTADDFRRARSRPLAVPSGAKLIVDEVDQVIQGFTGLPVDIITADVTDTRVSVLPGGVRIPGKTAA